MKRNSLVEQAALIALLTVGTVSWAQEPNRPTQANQPDQPSQADRSQDQRNRSQTEVTPQVRSQTYQAAQPQKVNKASNLIGMKIKNASGEQLGTIKDLVVDMDSGKVAYCVLSVDGGILKAERFHAVPLNAFQPSADGESVTLNADKTKLTQAEGFDRDAWPSMQNPAWGAEPFWKNRNETERLNRTDRSKPDQKPEPDRNTLEPDQPK